MYNRLLTDLKRTRDALAKKLDAIKTDVTSVNNSVTNLPTTLDSKFSALTSKVDGVKSDVAGVGGKVDTAQTALSSKVDAVGANVTAMGAKVDNVSASVNSMSNNMDALRENYYDDISRKSKDVVFEPKSSCTANEEKVIVDISGSGVLEGISLSRRYQNAYTTGIIVYIDDIVLSGITDEYRGQTSIILTHFGHVFQFTQEHLYHDALGKLEVLYLDTYLPRRYIKSVADLDLVKIGTDGKPLNYNLDYGLTVSTIKLNFKSKLKVVVFNKATSSERYYLPSCHVAYTLNE